MFMSGRARPVPLFDANAYDLGKDVRRGRAYCRRVVIEKWCGARLYYLEEAELTVEVRRDILREALFLWRTPFVTAPSRRDIAFLRSSVASSFLLAAAASFTFLAAVLTADFTDLLRSFFFSLCLCLLMADSWLANLIPPIKIKKIFYSFSRALSSDLSGQKSCSGFGRGSGV